MADMLQMKEKSVAVYDRADILVIGAGIAGIAAAVAAARMGKEVILIDKSTVPGGLATLGHVCIYLPLDDGVGNRIYGGLAEELLYTTIRYGYHSKASCWEKGTAYLENPAGRYMTHFNIPAAIFAFDELLEQEKIRTYYDVLFTKPVMEGQTIKGILCETKEGTVAFAAKQYVDASGDADLMFRAGAATVQKESVCSYWTYELEADTIRKGLDEKNLLEVLQLRWLGTKPHSNRTDNSLQTFDATSIEGVNGYLKTSRKLALEYLKQNQRDDYAMLTYPAIPQFRISRHIVGTETLSFSDDQDRYRDSSIGIVSCATMPVSPVFEYPYGGLVDDNVINAYAAGRIVSVKDDMAWEMMRLIPACAFTGEAAGTAAALSIDRKTAARDMDVCELQKVLAEHGICIRMTASMQGNARKTSTVSKDFDFMKYIYPSYFEI